MGIITKISKMKYILYAKFVSTVLGCISGLRLSRTITLENGYESISSHPLGEYFNDWKIKHGKVYESASQEAKKFRNFLKTHELVTAHNARYLLGQGTFDIAHNKFSDLSDEEHAGLRGIPVSGSYRDNYGNSIPSNCYNAPSLGIQVNPSSI